MKLQKHLKSLYRFLQRENFHLVIFWVVILILVSSVGISLLEPDLPLRNAFWWSIVTLTTVGYGDISPVTLGGRAIAVLIMFFGIGLLGIMSATLATILISKKMKEDKGMKTYAFKNHVILCEWNHRARSILKELRAASQTEEAQVILIADIEEKPVASAIPSKMSSGALTETVPLARVNPAPFYPHVARQRGWEGTVRLEVFVDKEGYPDAVCVQESSGHGVLDRAAAETVEQWRFSPARSGEVRFSSRITIPVRFDLIKE